MRVGFRENNGKSVWMRFASMSVMHVDYVHAHLYDIYLRLFLRKSSHLQTVVAHATALVTLCRDSNICIIIGFR